MILSVGIDLVEVGRVERLLARKGDRAIARLFTEGEAAFARSRAHPATHFAARLAAKEAAFKALAGSDAARLIGWREIEVVSRQGAAPALALSGRADFRAREIGVQHVHLSLTHTSETAGAVVILER